MPDENEPGAEQRRFKRIDLHFMAKFRQLSAKEDGWHTIFLRDLGAGGILFNHHVALEIGSVIDVSITFPASRDPIECTAVVVRVNALKSFLKIYEIAACFTDIDETQKQLIIDAAEDFFSKKNPSPPEKD